MEDYIIRGLFAYQIIGATGGIVFLIWLGLRAFERREEPKAYHWEEPMPHMKEVVEEKPNRFYRQTNIVVNGQRREIF
jgi:hypothetical protein